MELLGMIRILLFSGGVDSTIVLKRLAGDGIVPIIFHCYPEYFTKAHERNVRKLARLISPKSPYYIFQMKRFRPSFLYDYPYYEIPISDDESLCPLHYGDEVIIGYSRWIYYIFPNHRFHRGATQQLFIDYVRLLDLPFRFPLADMRRTQLDAEFATLPHSLQALAVSDTRDYDFGGAFTKAPSS
jgi:hypothetical protein